MRAIEFSEEEIKILRTALGFYSDYVHMEDDPYERTKALLDKITHEEV